VPGSTTFGQFKAGFDSKFYTSPRATEASDDKTHTTASVKEELRKRGHDFILIGLPAVANRRPPHSAW
jgi:hypothetical protein